MSILTKLFGGAEEINGSRVRAWANREKQKAKHSDRVDFYEVFVFSIAFLSHFGAPPPPGAGKPSAAHKYFEETELKYASDSTLFEIGCFMYVYILKWMIQTGNSHTEKFEKKYGPAYIELFQEVRGWRSIPEIFNSRTAGFSALLNPDDMRGEMLFKRHLTELVLRSENNSPPQQYDFSSDQLILPHDAIEAIYVEKHLETWMDCSLIKLIDALETHYR